MSSGGFLVKFNDQDVVRCYNVSFNQDLWEYTINDKETKPFPNDLKEIKVIIEKEPDR
ncbi:MAG: hypothetical protein KBD85_03460 [Elusimicrobia bacterium]|nr:hypothetical protein [Elusimicrobiota bacterium]